MLAGDNEEEKMKCAKAWTKWEMTTSRLVVDQAALARGEEDKFALAFARIECHYFVNKGFFEEEQLLLNVHRIRNIPAVIVQGRYDVVCPMISAWELHRAWPEAEFIVVPDAGHSMSEAGIRSALIEATDKFAEEG